MSSLSTLCPLLLLSPLSRHPVLSVLPSPPLQRRLSLATMFSGPAILILSVQPSRSLSLVPLCQSVTLPPRVDWIHLTGYTAYDITALWCMAERVVALRHHNLTSATERNGTRAWHCSPGLVFTLDWPLVVISLVTSSRDLFALINGSAALNLRIGPMSQT